ncbi:MAG: hypothetical protein QM820_47100 [Minicystis sp.]
MSQPLPFFLDTIADDVTQDFVERGITAKVLVGEWETFVTDGDPRVIFGLREGEAVHVAEQMRFGIGANFVTGADTVARPLFANAQRVIVWVTSPALDEPDPAKQPRVARAKTWNLANATLAAMWRSHGGVFQWGNLQWINEDRGAATYGAALSFVAVYPIPILDDDLTVGTTTQYTTSVGMTNSDGTENPPETSDGP